MSERSQSKLTEMVIRGDDYREDYEFELYGEPVTGRLRPLNDGEFFPLMAILAEHFGIDELDEDEVQEETMDKAFDQLQEASDSRKLADVDGIGQSTARSLRDAGYIDASDLADAAVEELTEVDGIGESLAERIKEDVGGEAEESGSIDVSKLDDTFIMVAQEAAKKGLTGGYDGDGNVVEFDEETREQNIEKMKGGYSIEIGFRVLEISGDVRDAEKFPGGRGSVSGSGNS